LKVRLDETTPAAVLKDAMRPSDYTTHCVNVSGEDVGLRARKPLDREPRRVQMELVDVLEIEADLKGETGLLGEHELDIETASGFAIDAAGEIWERLPDLVERELRQLQGSSHPAV
jgi:hypothetical protein